MKKDVVKGLEKPFAREGKKVDPKKVDRSAKTLTKVKVEKK